MLCVWWDQKDVIYYELLLGVQLCFRRFPIWRFSYLAVSGGRNK